MRVKEFASIGFVVMMILSTFSIMGTENVGGGGTRGEGNIVLYYPLDEGWRITAYDNSGYGTHGTLYGGATWVQGNIRYALEFDGQDDYILIPNTPSLLPGTSDFTVEVYIKTDGTSRQTIINNGYGDSTAEYYFDILADGRLYGWTDYPATSGDSITGSSSVNDGYWHHVIFLRDDKLHLFVDGVEDAIPAVHGNRDIDHSLDIYLGANTQMGNYFNGIMDEVYIYHRALSTEEIREKYEAFGLKLEMHLSEGEGTTAYDSSENNNDGTINGADWTEGFFIHALEFDGVDNYLKVSDDITLHLDSEESMTFEFWIKTNGSGEERAIFHKYSSLNPNPYYLLTITDNGKFKGQIRDSYELYSNLTSTSTINDGKWHYITFEIDRVSDKLTVYIDGNFDNMTDDLTIGTSTNNGDLLIGRAASNDRYFNGSLDEIRIYDRTLSVREIEDHYNSFILTVWTDKDIYSPGEQVNFTASYLGMNATNVTFKVEYPNGTYMKNTVALDNGTANTTFTLPINSPSGRYVVEVSSIDAKRSTSFEVMIPGLRILDVTIPIWIYPGDKAEIQITIENGFTEENDILVVFQALDPNKVPLLPDYDYVTVDAQSTKLVILSLQVPSNGPTGTYFGQTQILTEFPSDGGYPIEYRSENFGVT
jgi:hypothetical protein